MDIGYGIVLGAPNVDVFVEHETPVVVGDFLEPKAVHARIIGGGVTSTNDGVSELKVSVGAKLPINWLPRLMRPNPGELSQWLPMDRDAATRCFQSCAENAWS